MSETPKQRLTASRMAAMQTCPRRHYWAYEVGLRAAPDAAPLRFGSAWHRGMQARWQGLDVVDALTAATTCGDVDALDEVQVATLAGLLRAYYAVYPTFAPVATIHPEVAFTHAIDGSRTFSADGKIDGLAQLIDGHLAILEHKTTGESIDANADYWLRLRCNPQLLQYVSAARELGWQVDTVLYDVVRKPAIKPKQIKGEMETPDQYALRLYADCMERPEFYFARREVPVLDCDLEEFRDNRLAIARMILDRRRQQVDGAPERAWPRHVNAISCMGCPYKGFCLTGVRVDVAAPPPGFVIAADVHPELQEA